MLLLGSVPPHAARSDEELRDYTSRKSFSAVQTEKEEAGTSIWSSCGEQRRNLHDLIRAASRDTWPSSWRGEEEEGGGERGGGGGGGRKRRGEGEGEGGERGGEREEEEGRGRKRRPHTHTSVSHTLSGLDGTRTRTRPRRQHGNGTKRYTWLVPWGTPAPSSSTKLVLSHVLPGYTDGVRALRRATPCCGPATNRRETISPEKVNHGPAQCFYRIL